MGAFWWKRRIKGHEVAMATSYQVPQICVKRQEKEQIYILHKAHEMYKNSVCYSTLTPTHPLSIDFKSKHVLILDITAMKISEN